MGGLYVSNHHAEALKSIDIRELERLVDEAVWQAKSGDLHVLRLGSCGDYVSRRLDRFDRAILTHGKAKATKKRAETEADARDAGRSLIHAVRDMKNQMEEEEQEQRLVFVDDMILAPSRFTPSMTIRVSYRWRESIEDSWSFGAIGFSHNVDMQPNYDQPSPRRKPSRVRQEDELQDKLHRIWDHLRTSALHSVREYLTSGKDRTAIPEVYAVTTDAHFGGLNNYSTHFWRGR